MGVGGGCGGGWGVQECNTCSRVLAMVLIKKGNKNDPCKGKIKLSLTSLDCVNCVGPPKKY